MDLKRENITQIKFIESINNELKCIILAHYFFTNKKS